VKLFLAAKNRIWKIGGGKKKEKRKKE